MKIRALTLNLRMQPLPFDLHTFPKLARRSAKLACEVLCQDEPLYWGRFTRRYSRRWHAAEDSLYSALMCSQVVQCLLLLVRLGD